MYLVNKLIFVFEPLKDPESLLRVTSSKDLMQYSESKVFKQAY